MIWRDLGLALRSLARRPGFTAVAVLTLALGIGANTALFSIADPLLTRPLPVRAPEELVLFRTTGSPMLPGWAAQGLAPYVLFERIQSGSAAFAGAFVVAHEGPWTRMRVRDEQRPASGEIIRTATASGSFFETLGVLAARGRIFGEADDQPGAPLVAVITHGFWQRQYGGAPDVVGSAIALDMTGLARTPVLTATIVGVTPRGFHGVDLDRVPELWLPMVPAYEASGLGTPSRVTSNADRMARVIARLRPSASISEAQAEVDLLAPSAFRGLPAHQVDANTRIRVESAAAGYSSFRDRFRAPIGVMVPAVGLVLLMACANVAALLLARTSLRSRDIAIRLSLGSSRRAIVRLLLSESALLAVAGGALGLLVFHWVRLAAAAYVPAESGLLAAGAFDLRLLAFAAGISLLSALVVGLAPVIWMARSDVNHPVRQPQRRMQAGSVATLLRPIVPVQIAIALVLLIGALLALRTVQNLRTMDTGFAPDRLVQFALEGGSALVPGTLLDRLETLPGVESLTSYVRSGLLQDEALSVALRTGTARIEASAVAVIDVRSGFFDTLGVQLVSGRDETAENASGLEPVVLSESLARHLFGRPDVAVGQFVIEAERRAIVVSGEGFSVVQDPHRLVVGVVRDLPYASLRETHSWTMYRIRRSRMPVGMSAIETIVLRTTDEAASLVPSIRAAVADLGGGLQIRQIQTFRDLTEASIAGERLLAHVSSVFSGLALLLAAIGVYGVITITVAQRTPEIGLRMALGAQTRDVIRLVVRQVLALVVVGVALGLAAAWFGMRLSSTLLFGVAPHDPATLGAAVLVLVVIAAAAACFPASRAARRVDPIVALRRE